MFILYFKSVNPYKCVRLVCFSSELEDLTVKQLKEILVLNRVDYKGCCEKNELLERVKRLWNDCKTCPGGQTINMIVGWRYMNITYLYYASHVTQMSTDCPATTCAKSAWTRPSSV